MNADERRWGKRNSLWSYLRVSAFICGFIIFLTGCGVQHRPPTSEPTKLAHIPVILDTDIGNDNDDNFALVCLLRNPRFDVKLIATTDGQQDFRGRIIANLLTAAGRTDIPIGLGAGSKTGAGKEQTWIADFPLSNYKGAVRTDGVAALIETVHRSPTPITIIGIGPLQTLAAALDKDPSIAANVNFVGMQGSVFKGYGGSPRPDPEFNVKCDVKAAQKVFAAPWHSAAITPLDSCGLKEISLDGDRYKKLQTSPDPLAQALLASYAAWSGANSAQLHATTTQYDTVAIYLADAKNRPLLQTQVLKIAVTDDGMTVVSPTGREMTVATSWNDVEGYRDHLLNVLLGPVPFDSSASYNPRP